MNTVKTFTFTIEQIKEIYEAGITRGNDEATAYEWGGGVSGGKYDELEHAIYDIVNKDIKFDDDNYVNYKVIREWLK